jgi:hypothetical protein
MLPSIAFCTTCKGRVQHLRATLPRNLADNADDRNARFVVLDYGDTEGLLDYLRAEHGEDIRRQRVVVYSYPAPGSFRMAHAKNMAHRCGILEGADILVNMDADNYAAPGFAQWIAEAFGCSRDTLLWANAKSVVGRARQGLAGRTVVSADTFLKVGGFDEKYVAWAPEDEDFKSRVKRIAKNPQRIEDRFLYVIPHKDGLRFREYPEAKPTPEQEAQSLKEIRDADHVVANSGRLGMGAVFKNFGTSKPIVLGPIATRIFGIGLHKTATTSLSRALSILGLDAAHWPSGSWVRDVWDEMNGQGRSLTLERHYALCDLPFPILYRQLDTAYPGSKFILTTRDERDWLRSVKRHWDPAYNKTRGDWDKWPISNRLHQALYGRKTFDSETMLYRYRQHNAEVREYFRNRPADLLDMNMERDGWPELCAFLGKQIPSAPYPREFATRLANQDDILKVV